MKSNQKLTLLFWHRTSKADKNGFAPIICRISIDGEEEEEISIGRKVHIAKWDSENKRAIGGPEEKKTNQKIVQLLSLSVLSLKLTIKRFQELTTLSQQGSTDT